MSDITPPEASTRRSRSDIHPWIVVAIAAVAIIGVVWIGTRLAAGSDQERALEYARRACQNVDSDGDSEDRDYWQPALDEQVKGWGENADNAARAARLDPQWNELARAMDAEYRGWKIAADNHVLPNVSVDPAIQSRLDEAGAETQAHPVAPECRKAMVD